MAPALDGTRRISGSLSFGVPVICSKRANPIPAGLAPHGVVKRVVVAGGAGSHQRIGPGAAATCRPRRSATLKARARSTRRVFGSGCPERHEEQHAGESVDAGRGVPSPPKGPTMSAGGGAPAGVTPGAYGISHVRRSRPNSPAAPDAHRMRTARSSACDEHRERRPDAGGDLDSVARLSMYTRTPGTDPPR